MFSKNQAAEDSGWTFQNLGKIFPVFLCISVASCLNVKGTISLSHMNNVISVNSFIFLKHLYHGTEKMSQRTDTSHKLGWNSDQWTRQEASHRAACWQRKKLLRKWFLPPWAQSDTPGPVGKTPISLRLTSHYRFPNGTRHHVTAAKCAPPSMFLLLRQ